ncbi:MAG: SUMF1/EgtB/PvdO family nonheme iron enzyme [Rhodocyclaceae bacterium]|nr:SUMF1/EgtB/PvdO family nonheme iron enzyme [Rhodocyclaceae bacterium]
MLRGGSWINNARNCRSANRNDNEPAKRNDNIGFRLARAPPPAGGEAQPRHPSRPPAWPARKQPGRRRASRGQPESPPAARLFQVPRMNARAPQLPDIFPEAWASAWGQDRYGLWQAFEVKGVVQVMRWIPPGEFLMGSPENEPERWADRELLHSVVLTRGFWLADTACTQALWRAVLDESPSRFEGDDLPVEQVSWDEISARFLPELNRLTPGLEAALPTEAQWEYACRAGTQTPFWFGGNITPEQVNYDGNYPYAGGKKAEYRERTVAVKALPCNGWGLYQMHGNVREWCADWYGDYAMGKAVDPAGPPGGRGRVLRGGGWVYDAGYCRSASRSDGEPAERDGRFGFRLARGFSPRQAG